jgi:hypothetical protein
MALGLPIYDASSPSSSDSGVDSDSGSDRSSIYVSEYSKREYLLAQIKQKDAIIESLLKQVSLPFISFSFQLQFTLACDRAAAQSLPGDANVYFVLSDGNVPLRPEQPEHPRVA